jgi:hypothetical protein
MLGRRSLTGRRNFCTGIHLKTFVFENNLKAVEYHGEKMGSSGRGEGLKFICKNL